MRKQHLKGVERPFTSFHYVTFDWVAGSPEMYPPRDLNLWLSQDNNRYLLEFHPRNKTGGALVFNVNEGSTRPQTPSCGDQHRLGPARVHSGLVACRFACDLVGDIYHYWRAVYYQVISQVVPQALPGWHRIRSVRQTDCKLRGQVTSWSMLQVETPS